jgi:uncharacterized protein YuzE
MAFYEYDEEADALYILLVDEEEAAIASTVEIDPNVHVDLDPEGRVVGVEVLYAGDGNFDPTPVNKRFGLNLKIPPIFAA